MKEAKELIVQPKKELLELFEVKNGMKPVLDRLKEIATGFNPDVSNKVGRDFVASQAYAVSKSKTYLDGIGKELTQGWRDKTANVNSSRNDIKSFCDNLRDEIRKPLTDYENEQKEIVEKLKLKLKEITDLKIIFNSKSERVELISHLTRLSVMDIEDDGWGELEFQAFKAKDQAVKYLKECIEVKDQYDKDQKELARLRVIEEKREKEEKERKEKEENEARIAEEKRIENQKIENAKKEALEKADREKRIELEDKDKKQKAEIERIQGEKEDARKEKEEANRRACEAEAKIKRIEDAKEAAKQKSNNDKRENQRLVHNIILKSLIENGIEESVAKKVITLFGIGKVPNVKINYEISQ